MKKLYTALVSIILLGAIYGGGWFFMATKIEEGVTQFYGHDAPEIGIEFYGEKPVLSGFPFAPVITYKNGFKIDDVTVAFEALKLTGFPIPFMPLTLNIDNKLKIEDNHTKQVLELNYLDATIIIPKSLPNSSSETDMRVWQQNVGDIEIKHFKTAKQTMEIEAQGTIGLDTDLQPQIDLQSRISGYQDLIEFLVETEELKPLPAAIALSALNAMAIKDPETDQDFVSLKTRLQNRIVTLGPVRIMTVPAVEWPE